MPELPEVETSCRGIIPHLIGQTVTQVIIRQPRLRWPISERLQPALSGAVIHEVSRRGKYILVKTQNGTLIIHLGMSGSLRILSPETEIRKHDHVDLHLSNQLCLRYNDPRRFGAMLWTETDPLQHPLLAKLGVEPLSNAFTGEYLYQQAQTRSTAVKPFIMDSHIVTGVGNIYATEALFMAGLHPQRSAKLISQEHYQKLADCIKQVLEAAIEMGGTTLRDFVNSQGKPGYFKQTLRAYGRAHQPCVICGIPLAIIRLGQRATVYCKHCQH